MSYKSCSECDCWDSDREGCTMPSCDLDYACILEDKQHLMNNKAIAELWVLMIERGWY